jgi:hypothetical protein
MMGRLSQGQEQFFYSFRLDEAAPDDHPVREIAAVLDLSWVHSELTPYYSQLGRPTIDSATERKVRKQLAKGVGILKVAKSLGIGTGTVQRIYLRLTHPRAAKGNFPDCPPRRRIRDTSRPPARSWCNMRA